MKFLKFIFLFSVLSSSSFAQTYDFDKTYTPITFEGKIPVEFLSNVKEVTQKDLKEERELSKSGAKEFYIGSNFAQKSMMSSGVVYFNDPLSEMLNKIAAELLVKLDNQVLKDELRFFVTKYDVPNAFCWRNGYIYFNVGLLRDLENEAQIAYILCHEIIHYLEQHSFAYYKKTTEKLTRKQKKTERKRRKEFSDVAEKDMTKLLSDLKFSRENETEADIKGFELYAKTDYDINEAVNALKVLASYRDAPAYFVPTNLFEVFNNESYQLDTSDIYENKLIDTIFLNQEEINTDSLEFYSTHPDILKRIEKIETEIEVEKTKNTEATKNHLKFKHIEDGWEDYKTLLDFELLSFYDEVAAYSSMFYKSFKMLETYPENEYLLTQYAKSLFWLGIYAENRDIRRIGKREVFHDKNYVLYTMGKILKDDGFVLSQLKTLEEKHPSIEKVKIYRLRYEEIVNNKTLKEEYKNIKKTSEEFTNFVNYKSKER